MNQIIDPLKRKFAQELAQNGQRPDLAARSLFIEKAWEDWVAIYWPDDPEVTAYLEASGLTKDGLPTDVALAHYVWTCAQNISDDSVKFGYLKLFGEIRGLLKKPQRHDLGPFQQSNTVLVVSE